jgi:hypothetical protein
MGTFQPRSRIFLVISMLILLAEYQDPDFIPGGVGLIAGTYDSGGFKVGFDNFFLMRPCAPCGVREVTWNRKL